MLGDASSPSRSGQAATPHGSPDARYRLLLDALRDGLARTDLLGRIQEFNEAFRAMVGYERSQLLALTYFELTPQKWHAAESAILEEQVMTRGYSDVYEKEYVHADGSIFPVEVRTILERDESGTPVGFWAVVRDISERKRAERALKESERMLATLMANLPGMAYRCLNDRKWSQLFLSEGCEKLTGYKVAELVDNARVSYCDLIHPEDREMVWQEIQTSLAARESFRLLYRIVTAAGDTKWVWEQGQGVFDDDGSLLHLEGFVTDISERVGAEQALRTAEEQLRQSQKMEAVGQLAGGIAHDFNNLLTAIIGYCDLLLSDPVTEGLSLRDDIGEIRRAGERASSLTRQILAFSRRQTLRPKVVSLGEVLAGVEPLLRRTLGEDVELVSLEHSEVGLVEVDVHQFEQVLLNLAVNARDAVPAGGRLTLEVANVDLGDDYCLSHLDAEPGSYVMLSVSDTGSGMDPDLAAHIFEPFFTTKGPGRGTGLGLSTVYGIVRQSGGSIHVFSRPGEGTTFKVYLPRVGGPESTGAPAGHTCP